ncbi:exportin-2-like, partial [Ochotona princeps]|uniref:exportin-2-like n=1 Tax=Ochotona princeps TaxID=9978 RepID=UPI00271532C4
MQMLVAQGNENIEHQRTLPTVDARSYGVRTRSSESIIVSLKARKLVFAVLAAHYSSGTAEDARWTNWRLGPRGAATATNPVTAAAAALPLVQLLQQTLSAEPAVLRVAQEALDAKAAAEDFPKELLLLLVNPDTPPAAKQAGAIYFKNFVRRHWDVEPDQGGISVANRTLIKQHLLSLLLAPAAAKIVQLQLADACTRIATTDMPLDWPSLLPELMQQHLIPGLAAQQQLLHQHLQQQVAVLGMLHAVLKKYRTAFRSNEVLLELREILPAVQQPLLQAFTLALQLLQVLQSTFDGVRTAATSTDGTTTNTTAAAATRKLVCEVLLLCCKTFFSLNTVDIPEFFEDHMQEFFGGFIRLLQVDLLPRSVQQHSPTPPPQHQQHDDDEEDDVAGVEDKLRTQICLDMKLYADKYQEEFQPLVMACVQAEERYGQMMTCIDRRRKYDFTTAAAMEFLSSAASTAWQLNLEAGGGAASAGSVAAATGDPFSSVQLLKEICEKTILPNVQLRDCDVEQMEDTPLEFARRDLEGGEQHTRRSAALDLIKSLMKFHEELITALLLQAVQALSSQAAAKAAAASREGGGGAAAEAERLLDACTFLVLAVGIKGSTRVRGVHAVNRNVDTQQFFQSLLLKELQSPDVNKRFIIRVGAMKVVAAFRNVFDAQLLQGVLPLLVMHLSAKRVVVHTFAAYTIERLLSAAQNGQPRIDKAAASAGLKQALAVLLQQLQNSSSANTAPGAGEGSSSIGRGGAENEFLVKCTLRIFSFLKEDAADAILPALRVILDSIKRVSNNPSNPSFSHYLFECLATLVKLSCSNNSTRAAVEREVIPVLSVLVQQTVHEFVPYCFQ